MSKGDISSRKLGKDAARYKAARFKLPEGAGNITVMCAGTGELLLFTETSTYHVRSPSEVDPDETDPDAPWVTVKHCEYGSANPVVARTYLQGHELISRWGSFLPESVDKQVFMKTLDSIKESLLQCYQVNADFSQEFAIIVQSIEQGLTLEDGRHLNDLPVISNLAAKLTTYLINAKRAIISMCKMVNQFVPLPKEHSNFEHLYGEMTKANITSPQFLEFVNTRIKGSKRMIDLRNAQEHPTAAKETIIKNFSLNNKREIDAPTICITGESPDSIELTLHHSLEFLIETAETITCFLMLHAVTTDNKWGIHFFLQPTRDEHKPRNPARYSAEFFLPNSPPQTG